MAQIDLLDAYPKISRNLKQRSEVKLEDRRIAKQFGKEYFDGSRDQGYGGFKYDGRWKPIVTRMRDHYGLTSHNSVLDVGCAKGFLLHDFLSAVPGIHVAGLDISQYAIDNAMDDVKPFLRCGNATTLPYPDKSFDLVLAINTLHNLPLAGLTQALQEINRVSRKNAFVVLDAYRNELEKERLLQWNLTAETHMFVDEWERFFKEVPYQGDYDWFIP